VRLRGVFAPLRRDVPNRHPLLKPQARQFHPLHGTLLPGAVADATVLDPDTEYALDLTTFRSKSRNCPYHGWKVKGRPMATVVEGKVRMSRLG